MCTGYFAIGLAIKAYKPPIPTLLIMLGVGFLDIIEGLFIMLGIDQVKSNLNALPYLYFDLTFIDWDHSLVMAIFWSLVWGSIFIKNKTLAMIATAVAFSHFFADLFVHNNDIALYPHSKMHLGMGLWGSLGVKSWLLEGAFSAILAFFFWFKYKKRGVNMIWPCYFLILLFVLLSPWLSPMKLIASLNEPIAHLLYGLILSMFFLISGFIFSRLINKLELFSNNTK